MSILSVTVPDALHTLVAELAAHDGVSPDEFIAEALAEKIAALESKGYGDSPQATCESLGRSESQVIVRVPELFKESHDHLAPYNPVWTEDSAGGGVRRFAASTRE